MMVFGETGQVARELRKLLPEGDFLSRERADLSQRGACYEAIMARRPQAVINAAAYTAVDKAEEEPELAQAINGRAPGEMALACAELSVPLVHISTDYVFDGKGEKPFTPRDRTGPLGVYGRSKLLGEEAIGQTAAVYAILRTSWVFSAHGNNFVKTMLRLSQTRDSLSIVADQIGGPTPAADIARACLAIAQQLCEEPSKTGAYHFSGTPDTSWAGFAQEIFEQAGREVTVTHIPTSQFPTPAQRPANSRLDCTSLHETFGIKQPDWKAGLAEVLRDLEVTP